MSEKEKQQFIIKIGVDLDEEDKEINEDEKITVEEVDKIIYYLVKGIEKIYKDIIELKIYKRLFVEENNE